MESERILMASVTYSLGYKMNVKKYDSISPFFSITREVGENDTEADVIDSIVDEVEKRLFEKLKEISENFN